MKKKTFLTVLACWTLLLVCAGTGCILALRRYLTAYEAAQPVQVMETLMAETTEETWLNYAREGLSASLDGHEDADALLEEFSAAYLTGCDFTYHADIDGKVYGIYASGLRICDVTLEEGEDSSFGLTPLTVADITPCLTAEGLQSVTVELLLPEGDTVYINGAAVGEEALVEGPLPYEDLLPVEARSEAPASYTVYCVGPLYGNIAVTDASGAELLPDSDSTDSLLRFTVSPERWSVCISAPEDITLCLNGTELTAEDAAEVSYGILEGYDDFTGDAAYRTCLYDLSGLYREPVITAYEADGTELTPLTAEDGTLYFFHSNDEAVQAEYQSTAELFFSRFSSYAAKNGGSKDSLLNTIYTYSPLYYYVDTSSSGMSFACPTQITWNDLSWSDFSAVGERAFVCTLHYDADLSAKPWGNRFEYSLENTYRLLFIRINSGSWRAAEMWAVG